MSKPAMQAIKDRFSSHKPDQAGIENMRTIRRYVRELAYQIESLCPDSRAKSTSLTQLDAVMTYANSSIAQQYPLDELDV
jgi:hypothetical protein